MAANEAALYDERSIVRVLGMRRTLFVVPRHLVPAVHASSTRKIAERENARLEKVFADGGVGGHRPAEFISAVKRDVLEALTARGEALARDLSGDVPALRTKLVMNKGKKYEAETTITTLVLSRMTMDGTIVRVRPTGSWLSSQYRYAPMADIVDDLDGVSVEEGAAAVLGSYLATFGPATLDDCKWWTGWTVGQTRKALADCGAIEVKIDGGTAYVSADDEPEPVAEDGSVALLASLDPTPMGWKERDWYLGHVGEHELGRLFDRYGNIGPTVWVDGRIVGGWGQRPDGEVVSELFVDVGAAVADRIDEAAADLSDWLSGTVVVPRFRTPLEREIGAGSVSG